MKYMGSKRYLLNNGLGDLIKSRLPFAKRFADPFCGAGSVIKYVAQHFSGEILAGDLQEYAVVLAKSVIERTRKVDPGRLHRTWILNSMRHFTKSSLYRETLSLDDKCSKDVYRWVQEARTLCRRTSQIGPLWKAYGGHYFSPRQALTYDFLLRYLPSRSPDRNICLAAIIVAATRSAASPGHTAQPFQPTKTAAKYIRIAWSIDPVRSCEKALKEIAPLHGKARGKASVSDAKELVSRLGEGDLVIVDPPYSGVQYSRFYHVLETIARGRCSDVTGTGRYPIISERPQSAFSNVSQSTGAFEELMEQLASKQTTVIVTFPKGQCSNGLSGDEIIKISKRWFTINRASRIHEHVVTGKFSTLGGNNKPNKNNHIKKSRVTSRELLLLLNPKK